MKKNDLALGILLLTILFMPLQAKAGSVLLGDEPSFKGWEGRKKIEKSSDTRKSMQLSPSEPSKSTQLRTPGPYIGLGGALSINSDSDFKVNGLISTTNMEYDPGYGFNLVAGYDFDPIRIEAEFSQRTSDLDKVGGLSVSGADLKSTAYMINGYYDLKSGSLLSPLFGLGIGMINGKLKASGVNVDDTVFGYQITAGITGAVNKNINLDCYYRFQGAPSDFEKNWSTVSYDNNSVFLGLRYTLR